MKQNCKYCENVFITYFSRIKKNQGIFCSKICFAEHKKSKKLIKECLYCKKIFKITLSQVKKGGGKFCSRICYGKSKIGKSRTIIVGKKYQKCNHCKKEFLAYKSSNRKFCTKKCHIKYNKGTNHPLWTGNNVSYDSLHDWVARWRGKPNQCDKCGKIENNGRKINWANKNHKYRRVLTDWIRLCVPCHREYDKKYNGGNNRRMWEKSNK